MDRLVQRLGQQRRARRVELVDGAARDPDHPRGGGALAGVEARAVAKRAFERVRSRVLGVGPVAEPVGGVGIDAPDKRLRVGKGIAAGHHGERVAS